MENIFVGSSVRWNRCEEMSEYMLDWRNWLAFFIAKGRNSENAKFGGVEQTGNDWQVGR
jgi:hypothetical protein